MKTESMILRQSLQNRIVHWGVAFSTFILIASGIFQMPVSKRYMINELPLMAWSGDYHISLMLHYVGAFGLIFFVAFHLYFHIARAEFDIFPKKGDGVKSLKIIKAMLFGGVEPKSEKYLPEQRLAYFFIGLVLLLLIITGLVKTAKNLAGWNISDSLYLWSAQLHNLGMFLIILGIIGHLAAFIFKANRPLLKAMFSGKVDSHYIVERHSLWQEGVKMARDKVAENNLDSISCHTKPLGEVSNTESTQNKDQAMQNVNTESSLDSTNQTQGKAESKLANLPIALFASVMGIGGLSLVLKKASVAFGSVALANASFNNTTLHSGANALESSLDSSWQGAVAPFLWWGAYGFAVLAVVIFALLLVCYSAKIFYHFNAFKADLKHQVKINFLSSIPISMLIIVAFWSDLSSGVDLLWQGILGLFYVASALQLVLSLYVMSFWFKESMKTALLSPAWFIPIVGNLIVPLSGGLINAPKELLLFFFSIGCFFWILLSAMIMQRLIFEQSLESKFIPTLFIFIAPPSIFVVDFHSLFGFHNALSFMGFNVALFFVLLLLSLGNIFTKLNFAPSWWAFTFPLCAFGIASFDLYMIDFKCFYGLLGILGLVMAFFAVVFISYKTLRAVASGAIFKE